MVEAAEQKPPLTFKYGDAQASIAFQDSYAVTDAVNITSALGIKQNPSNIYDALKLLAPDSKITPNPNDLRITRSLTGDHLKIVVKYFIDKDEAKNSRNIRSFEIADQVIIDLEDITDYNWEKCEPLLNALRATRVKTESGEIQRTPLPFEEVQKLFPKNISRQSIFRILGVLNRALNPSGWSVEREGKVDSKGGKPFDAPWYLSGPDDNVAQNKGQSKLPKKGKVFDEKEFERTVVDERREVAENRFDRMAFATSVLLYCVSNLVYSDDKATKDPVKIMRNLLPTDVRLEKVIGKNPQEYFQQLIEDAVKSMAGKAYDQLPKKQQSIVPFWNTIKKQFGRSPKTVIFENFSGPDSNSAADEVDSETANLEEELIIKPKPTRIISRGKDIQPRSGPLGFSK